VAPGDYTYRLVGTLDNYGISQSVDFTVRALACMPLLDISRIQPRSMTAEWSSLGDMQEIASQINPSTII